MTNTTNAASLTRELWIDACADRYMTAGGLPADSALCFAQVCAEQQKQAEGPEVSKWEKPADAADEDMSYWESDE